ncbi:M20/M25/M40 family metallo-hydrolase [Cellulomonas sp. PS-H5]|uniref:M20/M25/M40 family metallo-hydrolase n=1 Tax=Cellulomonas sp. PS-H5 TaxID=2820400 RepID=UPI001C4E7A58|nr:M20/M25/M40 family metallo-hydrolase [Cellulomonas sp. PS-H5]MBW0255188.1 M20/M25/M40 family metallo-hydrolase [Cellulomonas sp. PS-H5]
MRGDAAALDGLDEAARRRLPADVGRLERYVRLETPTGAAEALDALADLVVADARAAGFRGDRVPTADPASGDAVVLDLPGRGPRAGDAPALLLAHHDTVHAVGSVPVRRDGDVLHGPGTYDMKGGLVVALAAAELLGAAGLGHRPVRLLVTPDEEVGSPATAGLIRDAARGAAYALGLEAPGAHGGLKTARRGSTRLRLHVTGRAAHAAVDPDAGVSATEELLDQLLAARRFLAEHPSVLANVGVVAGGTRTNVVAESARADLGLRFVTRASERAVLARLTEPVPVRPGADVRAEVLSRRPAWEPGAASQGLLAAVAAAAGRIGQDVTGAPAPGAADTNLTGAAGLPTLDGFGPGGGGAHAATERVRLPALASRAALLAATLHGV